MESILSISNLTAGYGKLTILHGIDLQVQPGQFVAVLGPNGSGKSTLLKTIFGLTDVSGGAIACDGQALLGRATEGLGELGLAYVPQRENVFRSMTVHENLLLAARGQSGTAAATALGECYALFPVLQKRLAQKAGKLSGGERQMVAIAMGWLARPKLMLLDEPSAGLSPLFVNEVFRTLKALCAAGITLVVVEQNARSILRYCDYAYILREGAVAFEGTAAEILADEETVKGYLGVGKVKT
jgi:ABC-type branched-subunit amino acid transport system ATPase component